MREVELLFIKSYRENQPEKVQAYLTLADDLKIDVNAVDEYGLTAAHSAAWFGHTEVIRILADYGLVNWNKADYSGFTPLHRALWSGHSDVAEIIMRQDNIDFSLKTKSGHTVAMAAVLGGSLRCVEILTENQNCDCWNIPGEDGVTPLMWAIAIRLEKKDIHQVLLKCPRVDPNLKNKDGNSPLMKAIKEKKTAMARLLIQCPRVDLRTRDRNGASLQRIARWEETKINLNFDEVIALILGRKDFPRSVTCLRMPRTPGWRRRSLS